jgi:hypothetical protein
MAKMTFQYGSTLEGGNSRRKLVVYLHGVSTPESVYSFDGRIHKSGGKNRLTDDEKFFTDTNAELFLKKVYEDRYSKLNVQYAFIADSFYNKNIGKIYTVLSSNNWTSQQVANRRLYEAHKVQQAGCLPTYYTFRLSVPTFATATKKATWKNFFTQENLLGYACFDLIAQFRKHKETNPQIKFQDIGQFYGESFKQFSVSTFGNEVPRPGYLDVKNMLPREHRSATAHNKQSIVTEYAAIMSRYQDAEEFISNCQ